MLYGLDEPTAAIYAPVQAELAMVEDKLKSLAPAEAGPLRPLLDYVAGTGGKRVRPAVTLLAAHSYPHDTDTLVLMACGVELLHLATLIHDDTVDDSHTRRGRATVGNVWGHHVSVLFGDYVFATSATFVCDTNNIRIMRRFSETIMDLASGELIEYFGAFDPEQAREDIQRPHLPKDRLAFLHRRRIGGVAGRRAGRPGAGPAALRLQHRHGLPDGRRPLGLRGRRGRPGQAGGLRPAPRRSYPANHHAARTLPGMRTPSPTFSRIVKTPRKLKRVVDMIRNAGIISDCEDVVRDYCDRACAELKAIPNGPKPAAPSTTWPSTSATAGGSRVFFVVSPSVLPSISAIVQRTSIVESVTVKNFRCFREEQTARMAPLTFLVGENSTGKDVVHGPAAGAVGCGRPGGCP